MASWFFWTAGGLFATLIGVVLFFLFAMPFHVPTGGKSRLLLQGTDHKDIAIEKRNRVLGAIGLILMIAGTGMQIYGAFLAAS